MLFYVYVLYCYVNDLENVGDLLDFSRGGVEEISQGSKALCKQGEIFCWGSQRPLTGMMVLLLLLAMYSRGGVLSIPHCVVLLCHLGVLLLG